MNEYFVGIAQAYVDSGKTVFTARALGSCVAVAIYSPFTKVGGMAHVLLPGNADKNDMAAKDRALHSSSGRVSSGQVARRADEAVSYLVSQIEQKNRISYGDRQFVLRAKIAGGAELFPRARSSGSIPVGPKNVQSVKEALNLRNITLKSEDVGGNWGRTVSFYLDTAKMVIKKINGDTIEI